jgi:hypothetical protein
MVLQGETGSLAGDIDLTNVGTAACSLLGRPTLTFTGPAASSEPWRVGSAAPIGLPATPVRPLEPGQVAGVWLDWENWCAAPPTGIALGLPDGSTITVPVSKAPRCDQPRDSSVVVVAPFASTLASHVPLAAEIIVTGMVRVKPGARVFGARRGKLLRYEVTLTNFLARPYRFGACPTYSEEIVPPAQTYVLNCKAAPVIGPHDVVAFAMEIRTPAKAAAGIRRLTWVLAPGTYLPPSATAPLRITP